MFQNSNSKSQAFTLIEVIMVVFVLIILSSFLVLYSRRGERQLILLQGQVGVIGILQRAKSLTLGLYGEANPPCGYGVHFSLAENKYLLFRDLSADCKVSDNIYSGPQELMKEITLDERIKFKKIDLTNIIFIPPDPKIVITPDQNEAKITLSTLDETAFLKVIVNRAGQITGQ